jgi:predicted Rossmann fold flavoprotein
MSRTVVVIGAGPAGMIAAGRAAASGARVMVLEKNRQPGVKLLLTGGGRCNITNTSFPVPRMAECYGHNGKFLISALSRFCPNDIIAFFHGQGVATKVEERGRVFPVSDRARDVLDALAGWMEKNGVDLRTGTEVVAVVNNGPHIERLVLADGREITADAFILATGGVSYRVTGATGEGYRWLESLGHTIVAPVPSLCAVMTRGPAAGMLQGLSLQDIPVTAFRNGKKIAEAQGDILFTENGVSGPAIFDISKEVGRNCPGGVVLHMDLLPDRDHRDVDESIVGLFAKNGNKLVQTILENLLPRRMAAVILGKCEIDLRKQASVVTREERKKLVALLKAFPLDVGGVAEIDRATVTAGGVSLREVDSKTMRSKIVGNLFIAGEILDLDGPTGGYNLQVCWSTGMAAGEGAAAWCAQSRANRAQASSQRSRSRGS